MDMKREVQNKLLLINNGYPSKEYPNYTTWAATIGKCLEKSGFKVDLLVIKYRLFKSITKIKNYLLFFYKLLTIDLSCYEIIYINYPTHALPIFFNRTLKLEKVYMHWHGYDLIGNYLYNRIVHKVLSSIIRKCRHFTPSQWYRNILINMFKASTGNVFVSPSGGVDIDLFKPMESKRRDNFVIGFASGLSYDKGIGLLFEIMLKYREIEKGINIPVEFNIINYAPDAHVFIDKLNKNDIPITVFDKMGKSDMYKFYNAIDLIMTSESESLGLIVLEAMSCNIPVVTFDICAFPDFVISSVSGERVKHTDNIEINAMRFIESIITIKNNYNTYTPREIVVRNYSENSVIEQYKTVLNER
jgi:glycosyltransferase involved in cell wall biosynthesis